MSKKFNDMKWDSVAVEGFPVSMTDKFQGFVGLEECTSYNLDKENKRSKKVNYSFITFVLRIVFN